MIVIDVSDDDSDCDGRDEYWNWLQFIWFIDNMNMMTIWFNDSSLIEKVNNYLINLV